MTKPNWCGGVFLCLALALAGCKKQEQASPPDSPRLTPNTTMVDVTFHSRSLGRDIIAGLKRCATLKQGSRPAGSFRSFTCCMGGV